MLVVSGCDTSELFDPVEEAFHEVPLPIDPARGGKASLAIGLWRDVGPSLSGRCLGANGIAVISLVGQQDVSLAQNIKNENSPLEWIQKRGARHCPARQHRPVSGAGSEPGGFFKLSTCFAF